MDDLLPDFIAETRETLQAVAGGLVAWEADPGDRARLDEIFRFVHTVKGSCGFLDLPRIQHLSHAAEDALSEVRGGSRIPDAALVTAILAIVDRIGLLSEALETGEEVSDADEGRLVAALAPARIAAGRDAPAAPRVPAARAPSRTVRLPVELLDRIMGGVSDMVLARNELAHDLGGEGRAGSAFERLSQCVGELRESVTRARMARIETLFAGLPRLARDLALELGKAVRLEVDGGAVELDREMIEMIRDPLLHVVRNAIDHGIEAPAARVAAGKPGEGRVAVRAWQSGSRIRIEVSDDGAGIDVARLVAKAVAAGAIPAGEAAGLDDAAAAELIFTPGLSTARAVTEISGRGVGMDVVRANVERLGGGVTLHNQPGEGLRLVLEVPLTLTILPALTVSAGGHCFAIARSAIDEIVRPSPTARLERLGGGVLARVRGAPLPLVDLASVMALPSAPEPALLVILRTATGGRYALGVAAVHDHEELVIKPAVPAVLATGLFAGTTLPDNSRPMLLLDVSGIAAVAGITPALAPAVVAEEVPTAPTLPTLLFRDLDGGERGVRLDEVERIEDAPIVKLVESGGRRLLATASGLVPAYASSALPDRARLPILRIRRGDVEIAYVVERVADIADCPAECFPARVAGPVAGVVLHEGRPVELLDAAWLVAERGAPLASMAA